MREIVVCTLRHEHELPTKCVDYVKTLSRFFPNTHSLRSHTDSGGRYAQNRRTIKLTQLLKLAFTQKIPTI